MTIAFWKYHGLGNDFVLVDRRGLPDFSETETRAICDRHTGVGADGVLGLFEGEGGLLRMRVFNSDGSVADMCGNGLRCFVAWAIEVLGVPAAPMTVLTDAGPQRCEPRVVAGRVDRVRVNLGAPTFEALDTVEVDARPFAGMPASVGNPHFVMLRPPDIAEAERVGYHLSVHPRFPKGANIEWLQPTSRRSADLVVYERGCGLTRACGTGGGASASVGAHLGLFDVEVPITIRLPGGVLDYEVAADFSSVHMSGPAEAVFAGTLDLARLRG